MSEIKAKCKSFSLGMDAGDVPVLSMTLFVVSRGPMDATDLLDDLKALLGTGIVVLSPEAPDAD